MKRFVLPGVAAICLSVLAVFPAAASAEEPGSRIETVLTNEQGQELKYPSCTLTPANGFPVYSLRVAVNGKVIIAKNTRGLLRCRHKRKDHEARLDGHQTNRVTLQTLPPPNFSPRDKCRAECFKLLDVPIDASAFPDQFYADQTPEFFPCIEKCYY